MSHSEFDGAKFDGAAFWQKWTAKISSHPKILVVEDDPIIQTIFKNLLTQINPGILVDITPSAEEAFSLLKRKSYSFVISDIFLSGKVNGLDFWRICRKKLPKLPFLLTSGLSSEAFLRISKNKENIPAYMQKPFFLGQCRDTLKKMLTHSV